jgi:small conductance mechanosensitive channel
VKICHQLGLKLVMLVGIIAVLRRSASSSAMLTGLSIAGFVLGFALQDTLANFASGAMILAYHPYDIGDIIEVAGATGTVKKMSLVSTTILTFDNQTLVVPNKKMWGDVIRNITAQDKRRVDMIFSAGYENDVASVEALLKEIVDSNGRVLKEPAPLIKLHQLADSSVNYVVRIWTRQEDYWDVYWDVTRAVKLRFDEAGIKIPYPQASCRAGESDGRQAPKVVMISPAPPIATRKLRGTLGPLLAGTGARISPCERATGALGDRLSSPWPHLIADPPWARRG